ncbi:hypothetical protein BB559_000876 [Furculomyces boomerangus]|uniref:CBM1 domain-containing protein n=1 Tax=Furculomyces boomerangus TaxID=61424 RepID=A0A2T9Z3U1_9FUNG|nr:hypothetical protein BB559_000876 [Furculomyces boomerangus]
MKSLVCLTFSALMTYVASQNLVGSPCSGDNMICFGQDGTDPKFNACNGLIYVNSQCGEGTYCYTSKPGTIYCGYIRGSNGTVEEGPQAKRVGDGKDGYGKTPLSSSSKDKPEPTKSQITTISPVKSYSSQSPSSSSTKKVFYKTIDNTTSVKPTSKKSTSKKSTSKKSSKKSYSEEPTSDIETSSTKRRGGYGYGRSSKTKVYTKTINVTPSVVYITSFVTEKTDKPKTTSRKTVKITSTVTEIVCPLKLGYMPIDDY